MEESALPAYRRGSYGGESVTLANRNIRLDIHKRITGWGWGEIRKSGKLLCILEHLGELMVRDQEIPMRLEAREYHRESGDFGVRIEFQVESVVIKEKLRGTSFEPWINYPLERPCMDGRISLTLDTELPLIHLSYELRSLANQYARYVRGPWLKVGEGGFGSAKSDGIFPGVEWLIGDEWSSGTDWFKDPWAQRFAPHPNKVTCPIMAVSHDGSGIGLGWNPNQDVTGWFNYERHQPQPVFASPNFVDRQNNHLLGLMVPRVFSDEQENQVYAEPPLELHFQQLINFNAEIWISDGDSIDVFVDKIKRGGLPAVPEPRWPFRQVLDRIASAYTTRFWHEGKGFGTRQFPDGVQPSEPRFADRFIRENSESQVARILEGKINWCKKRPNYSPPRRAYQVSGTQAEIVRMGEELLKHQKDDGSFVFDPEGRHYVKDDFIVAREYLEPMGLAGDTALDICIVPATELLLIGNSTGVDKYLDSGRSALEFCMPLRRPEGGDFWETPLHSPNLLAAGHAANAYYLAYRIFGDVRYRDKAVHWIRCLLPFTHLWQPDDIAMLYNTKPCLCASDWYFANWVRDHVQWEVLETFAQSISFDIRWHEVDTEIDWRRYHAGVTAAALRWMIDHHEENWLPHNLPDTLVLYREGLLDDCFADTHNSTTGNYGGAGILPDVIAINLMAVLDYRHDAPDKKPAGGEMAPQA